MQKAKNYTVDVPTLEHHMPSKERDIVLSNRELLGSTELPEKASHCIWFSNIELALKLFNSSFLWVLTEQAIDNLGPILLGPLAWDQVTTKLFCS